MTRDDIDTRRMTVETIARALYHHQDTGAIKSWRLNHDRWEVTLAGTGPFHVVQARSKREVGILLAGLTSAEYGAKTASDIR